MKLRKLFLAWSVVFCTLATAQEFKVLNYEHIANDISGRKPDNIRTDLNGEKCAIVKIRTNNTDILVESGLQIEDRKAIADGEFWIWIRVDERRLTFRKEGLKPLVFTIPLSVEPLNVYTLDLIVDATGAADADLRTLTLRFNTPEVYIGQTGKVPMATPGLTANFSLPVGTYSFSATKKGFADKTFKVQLRNDTVVDITLAAGAGSTKLKLPGIVTINSNPQGATVLLNGQSAGVTPLNKELVAGDYDLRLDFHLYSPIESRFTMAEGETKELPVFTLKPRFGYLTVQAEPGSAEITLDNKPVGMGQYPKTQISSGVHTVSVANKLYHTSTEKIAIADGESKVLNVKLEPAFGTLHILSEPAGAQVYVDNQQVGTTPYTNEKCASATYLVKVSLPQYTEATASVTVSDGKATNKTFAMSANFGVLTIVAPDATVTLNGKVLSPNNYKQQLAPGEYTLTAEKPHHRTDTRKVFVRVGSSETVSLAPEPIMGGLSIITNPAGAAIVLDGIKQKQTTPVVLSLLEGSYKLQLTKPGYDPVNKNISITEGETTSFRFDLSNIIASRQKHVTRLKSSRVAWLSLGAALGGTGAYMQYKANDNLERYNSGDPDVGNLKSQVKLYNTLVPVMYGLGGACLVPVVTTSFKINRLNREIKLNLSAGTGTAIQLQF